MSGSHPAVVPSTVAGGVPSDDRVRGDYAEFLLRYPGYGAGGVLDACRARDFARLGRSDEVYLDYTGGGLYAESLVRAHAELLTSGVFGNPHSESSSSSAMTALVDSARRAVLRHFGADPEEFVAIFTANASAALKLVGESYPFARGSTFLLSYDNHNSVNGMREFAAARGARIVYAPVRLPELGLDEVVLRALLDAPAGDAERLFAYPAQSNFSGVLHPLDWAARARERGWDVMLDCAAYAPTHPLDLSAVPADFVAVSFYKMFGYPTGVGALLARRSALAKLRRPWFSGGTVSYAAVARQRHDLFDGAEAFEDGTLNYLALPAVEAGLDRLKEPYLEAIGARVMSLTAWTLERLRAMRHRNGRALVRIYGPEGTRGRGGAIAFNLLDVHGSLIDHRLVEQHAALSRISLRTGCFCNPGAGETALEISGEELAHCFARNQRMTPDAFRECLPGKGSGAVRVSFGEASTFADAHALVRLAETFGAGAHAPRGTC